MAKAIWIITALVFCGFCYAGEVRLSNDNIPYMYESRAAIAAPDHKMAELISVEYRRAKDEFTRHDLFKQIKPVLEDKLREGKNTKTVTLRIGTEIGEYDFEKTSFPTGLTETTFVPFSNGYAATFINGNKFANMFVPVDRARGFAPLLRKSRQGVMVIVADVVGTEEINLDWRHKKALKLRIRYFQLIHQNGKELGEKRSESS